VAKRWPISAIAELLSQVTFVHNVCFKL